LFCLVFSPQVFASVAETDELTNMFQRGDEELKSCLQPSQRLIGCIGSTMLYNPKTESVLQVLGVELAKLRLNNDVNLALATGGFKGVGETLTRAFEKEASGSVYLVLPETDPQIETLSSIAPVEGQVVILFLCFCLLLRLS
jgi:hypothetical protein